MARSANGRALRALCALGVILGAAGPLAGCTTTQTKAARLQLNSARLRASESATAIGYPSTVVGVVDVRSLREPGGTAFVVTLENRGRAAVSDLPIRVGYRLGDRAVYVNGTPGTDYFASHLPLVRGRSRLSWVFTSRRDVPRRAKLLATVGAKPAVSAGRLQQLPAVHAKLSSTVSDGIVRVSVTNSSGVTQYGLPLYVVGDAGGRVVAAGETTIGDLSGGATRAVRVRLLGSIGAGTSVHAEASPTIFN